MSFAWLFTNALAWCLLPPGNSLLLFLVAWVLRRAWPEVARLAALVGGAMLLFLSLPVVGEGLLIALEPAPLTSAELAQAQWKAGAIVVLGDGRDLVAPEYGGETVSRETLQRLRYAAWLQRQTGLPILVTGGRPDGGKEAEGRLMNRALEDDFGAWVRWEEDGARSTRENANNAAALLTRDHVGTVLLVSHDRSFMDACVSHVAALENRRLTTYVGNYTAAGVEPILNIASYVVVAGGIIGGALIEYFCALLTDNTIESARLMADEGDRQLSVPGVLEGTVRPDYNRLIEMAARQALRKMFLPSVLALIIPVVGGFLFGVEFVGGLLIGATIVAIPRAIFMGNSGGAFDNAKKYIEGGFLKGVQRGSPAHKASVVGDTVGDTRKDVVGVALDIFIKTMSTVANTLAVVFQHITLIR